MKTLITILFALLLSGIVTSANAAGNLQHVVSFKFKTSATPSDIKNIEQAFQALPPKIPQIKAFEWGTNVSRENKDKGFTHCFILSFKTRQDLDAYIVHPDHKAFAQRVGPLLDDVFVLDFWSKK